MTRAREYYGQALIAGISVSEARHMLPGFIMDMFLLRTKYDAKLAGAQLARRTGLI